jgi:acetyltransferase-like isoleucine patch superfamily enzyme
MNKKKRDKTKRLKNRSTIKKTRKHENPNPCEVNISSDINVHPSVEADVTGGLTIKAGTVITEGCKIFTHQHLYHTSKKPIRKNKEIEFISLVINEDVFIGIRSIILPQVTNIPKGCYIAAGSVLTKNPTGEYEVWAGNPARKIGVRGEDDEI